MSSLNPVNDRWERTKWFREARFGMFIHWGIYAIPARGEKVRMHEKMPLADYEPFFREFDPTGYDPVSWAKTARKAGMKYAVMTAKHHDGFCLFDSSLTGYKSTDTPAGRDLIREYVDAFRAEGLKVGLYYSLLDWHHPDYPTFGDAAHPMRLNEEYRDKVHDFSRYVEYMHGQVRELLSNYGKVDIIWFDYSYGDMTGEKWEASKLVEMARRLQPGIIIDNRLGPKEIMKTQPEIYAGDFASPEQIIPPGGILNDAGNALPWEACITLNDHWGYFSTDHNYKTPETIIKTLVECVSKNGNLLLNIGPDARGRIPAESLDILDQVGKWMEKNSASIYGCGLSELSKPEWGRYTLNGNKLYAHIYERGVGPINISGMKGKIKKARLLQDCSEMPVKEYWNTKDNLKDEFISFTESKLPDEIDTVVEFELY